MLLIYARSLTVRGFSFLELLIALLILSITLLGVAGSASKALILNHNSYLYSLANLQLMNLYERDRLQVATREFANWNQTNLDLLPKGWGSYENGVASVCWWNRDMQKMQCLSDH